MVQDIYEINPKMNSVLSTLTQTEFFKIFRVNLYRPCEFWSQSAKCRINQCPIEEEDALGNATHIKTYLVDKTLTKEDTEFTKHIRVEEYNDTHSGEQWIFDEHTDSEGIFVDLLKNPERYSGYNGSSIWHEVYEENLNKMKFATPGPHEQLLYKIVSGVHVNVNMHISRYYLDDIEEVYDPDEIGTDHFYRNYEIYYERIGKHPDRIQNLFYTYVFLID